jgi:regulatory protein
VASAEGSSPGACRERALRLLATRSHFTRELARKLARRGFDEGEVRAVVGELEARRYLDDARTARELVAERRERRGWGLARLRAELVRRGAPAAAVDAALAGLSVADDLALARVAAERWGRRGGDPVGPARAAALGRHLARKGFSHHAILAVLAEAGAVEGADLEGADPDPAD